jgi:D-glycero-alpha-D-manno-heptose-7-phosphate kinase
MIEPGMLINAVAPIRICDIGGWTDTWFARQGAVFNIAVYPYVEVQMSILARSAQADRIIVHAENFGQTYPVRPEQVQFNKHPLIEAAVTEMRLPDELALRINIFSDAPPGASTGTSAAVSVALIGALDALTPGRLTPHEAAALAHRIESEKLKMQSGIQDQLASAYGGLNFIQMHAYPRANVSSLQVPNAVWWELENRLATVYIGTPHSSHEIHQKVIAGLGPNPEHDARLERLRQLAVDAKNAVYAGDFAALGRVMDENTGVQRALHPGLVCPRFEEVIALAREFGVIGCKVNGAGGDGGSLTLLTDGDMRRKREMLQAVRRRDYQVLPLYLSRQGLRVWRAR